MDSRIPNWAEFFMNLAEVTSTRSKDPNTKVGCCIVSASNRVLSLGYNGMPEGMSETEELWKSPIKYNYVIHAEANALLNYNRKFPKGAKLFCTLYPCEICAKLIIAAGIKKVFYKMD